MQPILGITSLGKFLYQVAGAFQHQAQWSLHKNMASILPLPICWEQFASNTQPFMLAHLLGTISLKHSATAGPSVWKKFPQTQPLMLAHLLGTISLKHSATAGPSVWNNFPQTQPLKLAHLLGTICPKHSDSASSFKAALKMHLFSNYFSQPCLSPTWHANVCVCVLLL